MELITRVSHPFTPTITYFGGWERSYEAMNISQTLLLQFPLTIVLALYMVIYICLLLAFPPYATQLSRRDHFVSASVDVVEAAQGHCITPLSCCSHRHLTPTIFRQCCSALQLSPDMPTLSQPVLMLLTLLRDTILALIIVSFSPPPHPLFHLI